MKIALKLVVLCFGMLMPGLASIAQQPTNILTESSDPRAGRPVDDITDKRLTYEKRVLPYDHVREADIFWEKRIWRVIDVREKMNLPFSYPERPFFSILMDAATNNEITVYSTEDDKFTSRLTSDEVVTMGARIDTVITFDPDTYEEKTQIVSNDINPEDVRRYRIKEVWFFDKESSTMQVRILGIAPLLDIFDDAGNFKYEKPMFWVYYPEAREILARERVFNTGNDASPMSWEDLLEMRYFSSYIWKESNVKNERIQDYLSGIDILFEADKIKQAIFNFEHDLWEY
jgi:gliding motility associated protien GldN